MYNYEQDHVYTSDLSVAGKLTTHGFDEAQVNEKIQWGTSGLANEFPLDHHHEIALAADATLLCQGFATLPDFEDEVPRAAVLSGPERHSISQSQTSFSLQDPLDLFKEALLTDDSKSVKPRPRSHRRERPRSHTPRPANSFIIYRREKHLEIMDEQRGTSVNNNVISKVVADMWRNETPVVKALYAAKADEEKRLHALKYPDYKYKPRKSTKGMEVANKIKSPKRAKAPLLDEFQDPADHYPGQYQSRDWFNSFEYTSPLSIQNNNSTSWQSIDHSQSPVFYNQSPMMNEMEGLYEQPYQEMMPVIYDGEYYQQNDSNVPSPNVAYQPHTEYNYEGYQGYEATWSSPNIWEGQYAQ